MIRKTLRTSVSGLVLGALVMTGAGPAQAADPEAGDYRVVRSCDSTACYVAWHVIDSDNDGVCDADEVRAGTDPHDPASTPNLTLIAELLLARGLPSFEYGRGTLLAFPREIVELRENLGFDPRGAFPPNARPDLLTTLGIDRDLLTKMGISADRDGFSLGLDVPKAGSPSPIGIKVAGIDASLISAGTPNTHVARGGVVETGKDWRGNTVNYYADGSKDTIETIDHGIRVTTTDADGSRGNTVTKDGGSWKEDGITVVVRNEQVDDPDGNTISSSSSVTHVLSGALSTLTTTKEYIRDEDGKVVGVIITESLDYTSADGSFSSHGETRKVCDANGESCSERSDYTESPEYADPDQAYSEMVTQEMVDGVLRTRGAAVRVVEGWTAPEMGEDPINPFDLSTIMLVDDLTGEPYLLTEPKITTAQPETSPDLPNPGQEWTGAPPSGGGCSGLC